MFKLNDRLKTLFFLEKLKTVGRVCSRREQLYQADRQNVLQLHLYYDTFYPLIDDGDVLDERATDMSILHYYLAYIAPIAATISLFVGSTLLFL